MEVKVLKTVPGYVENRFLNAGEIVDISDGIAVSLINDGYVEPTHRATPADNRETATPPGRRGRSNK